MENNITILFNPVTYWRKKTMMSVLKFIFIVQYFAKIFTKELLQKFIDSFVYSCDVKDTCDSLSSLYKRLLIDF